MALPQVEDGVIELVREEEAAQKRQEALDRNRVQTQAVEGELVDNDPVSQQEAVSEAKDVAVRGTASDVAVKTSAPVVAVNVKDELAAQGFADDRVDYTSFPTVVLNDGKFSTSSNKNFGTEFECIPLSERPQWVYKGDKGRDKDPELVYSEDRMYTNQLDPETGEYIPVAKFVEEWKNNADIQSISCDEYKIVTVDMIETEGNPHGGEICQLQISPASLKKWNGFKQQIILRGRKINETVVKVQVGAEIGSGRKAFHPWDFKIVK